MPKQVNFRQLAREGIITRVSSYGMRRKGNRILKDVAVAICEYYQLNFSDYFESIEIVRPYALETLKATDAYYAQYSMRLYAMSELSEILYPL